ncbi:MAG: PQQ-dependent sugar dehydrogenase [Chloroflexi bacterium]|nr:PQQ-dependent sugar dehydrogenase [Chloroflexota bacterium]
MPGPQVTASSDPGQPSPTAGGASATPTAGISDAPPPLALEAVAEGLASPIGIASAPHGWLIVNEQAGRARAIHPGRGERSTSLDIRDRVLGEGERGLLGLALHPDWPQDGRAFVHYSDRDGDTVLAEFTGTQDGDGAPTFDPSSERLLLRVEQPFANHNGGQIAFGPDGHLWLGLGDGGSAGDPMGHGQNPSTLLGAVLRLDVSQASEYGIPQSNPFADGGGGAPEVYLYGLRNPWRFSFDPVTNLLWIADVGQNAYEEINRIHPEVDAGANLGWNTMEASHCFADAACSSDGLVLPVAEYGRDLGCSVTGGHVYRGRAIEGLGGWYLFSDYCGGRLFGIPSDTDGSDLAPRILLETGQSISSFGTDADGELYVTDIGGGVLSRIVAGG